MTGTYHGARGWGRSDGPVDVDPQSTTHTRTHVLFPSIYTHTPHRHVHWTVACVRFAKGRRRGGRGPDPFLCVLPSTLLPVLPGVSLSEDPQCFQGSRQTRSVLRRFLSTLRESPRGPNPCPDPPIRPSRVDNVFPSSTAGRATSYTATVAGACLRPRGSPSPVDASRRVRRGATVGRGPSARCPKDVPIDTVVVSTGGDGVHQTPSDRSPRLRPVETPESLVEVGLLTSQSVSRWDWCLFLDGSIFSCLFPPTWWQWVSGGDGRKVSPEIPRTPL